MNSKFFHKNDNDFLCEFNNRLNLQRNCIEKHLFVPPVVTVGVTLLTKEKKVKDDFIFFSSSYVRNFYNWLVSQLSGIPNAAAGTTFGDGSLVIKFYNGTIMHDDYSLIYALGKGEFIGFSGETYPGISVGAGVSVFNFNDYSLSSQIVHGSGIGQLAYLEPSSPNYTWSPDTRLFTVHHERSFNNAGSSDVSVKEVGIYAWLNTSYYDYDFTLILRDLLPAPITIPPSETLSLTYNFFITYPS